MEDILQHEAAPQTDIWQEDLLERQQDARFLIDFLSRRSRELVEKGEAKSYVLNINSAWGQGKTFFLRRLVKQLAEENYVSVYINAWTDDHAQDPLVAVIAALDEALKPFTKKYSSLKKVWQTTKSSGLEIVSAAVVHATKQLLKRAIGESGGEAINEIANTPKQNKIEALEVAEAALEASVEELVDSHAKSLIKYFNKNKTSMQSFKANLTKLIEVCQKSGKEIPLFIVIDELDRCRPTYAIQLLERIRHLFDVANVVFVIATDTEQLRYSVNAVYGNDFDSKRYLLRFFDHSYSFTIPNVGRFVEKLFLANKTNSDQLSSPAMEPLPFIISMFLETRISLRDIEQCMDILETIITIWKRRCRIQLLYLIPLIIAHQQGNKEIFNALADANASRAIFNTGHFIPQSWQLQFEGSNFREWQPWQPELLSVTNLVNSLCEKLKVPLPKAMENSDGQSSSQRWIRQQFQDEFMMLHNGTYRDNRAPFSVMIDYPRLVQQAGRLSRE